MQGPNDSDSALSQLRRGARIPTFLTLLVLLASCGSSGIVELRRSDEPTGQAVAPSDDEAQSGESLRLQESNTRTEADFGEMEVAEEEADMPVAAAPEPTTTLDGIPAQEQSRSRSARPGNAPSNSSGLANDRAMLGAEAGQRAQAEEAPREEPAPQAQTWRRLTGAARFASVDLGGGNSLELRDVQVSVKVEGFRARTVVDHIFFNPHDRNVEGTFRYALPPEASVSSYAMYLGNGRRERPVFFDEQTQLRRREEAMQGVSVEAILEKVDEDAWGELRVGRIVQAERGREVYENVTRRRVDPALVEEVAPNTFAARVFPIQARGFHRVIVSYEQTLPRVGNELEYAFPIPEAELGSLNFELFADQDLVRGMRYTGDLRGRSLGQIDGAHAYAVSASGRTQAGALSFRFPMRLQSGVEVVAGTNPVRQENHFIVRVQGDDSLRRSTAAQGASHAVFLLDTSLSEAPERFGIDVALMREILERSSQIEHFNIVTFDAGARWVNAGRFYANNPTGRSQAISAIEGVLLEGATDLSAALDTLQSPPGITTSPDLDIFLLSDGALSWGEQDLASLESRLQGNRRFGTKRLFAYRTGLGAENTDLFRRLSGRFGGGVFNCLSMESVPGCATGHHHAAMQVERVRVVSRGQNGAVTRDVLVAGGLGTFAPGTELIVGGELERAGAATLRIEGTLGGQPHVFTRDIELRPDGELASRAWAEIAMAHLIAAGDDELEPLAVALGQHYRIPSRLTSFLVLETDAEYEQYELGTRGPAELLAARRVAGAELAARAPTSWARLRSALEHAGDHHHLMRDQPDVWRQLRSFVAQAPRDFVRGRVNVPMLHRRSGDRAYLSGISHEAGSVEHFRQEGIRRQQEDQVGAAIRALSSAVENAPSDAEVARSVGYTLMTWGARAEAAELFFNVLEKRPYEPQSYRDLAGALWLSRPSLTAMLFEAVLSGNWDGRFRGVVTVVREEYALFTRALIRSRPDSPLASFLRERQQALNLSVPDGDLRVTMTWNTDNTDIDLWVTDPNDEKCYYAHRNTAAGGQLLDDVTQGFGPERFFIEEAPRGEYLVQAHYYSNNGNRLVADTYVTLTIARHVGTDRETIERRVVRLVQRGDVETAARVQF